MGGAFRTHERDERCAINSTLNPGKIQLGSVAVCADVNSIVLAHGDNPWDFIKSPLISQEIFPARDSHLVSSSEFWNM
jgi:hypothetical protein